MDDLPAAKSDSYPESLVPGTGVLAPSLSMDLDLAIALCPSRCKGVSRGRLSGSPLVPAREELEDFNPGSCPTVGFFALTPLLAELVEFALP